MRAFQTRIVATLVLAALPGILGSISSFQPRLRGLLDTSAGEPYIFRITTVSTTVEGKDGKLQLKDEQEKVSCIPIIDGKEVDDLFAIDLPSHFVQTHKSAISTGELFVSITNAAFHGTNVVLSKNSSVSVISTPRSGTPASNSTSTGTKTIALVRISTSDASPMYDARTLHETLFSLEKVNFRTQYSNCSFGQLQWLLAPAGVMEVAVDQPTSAFPSAAELVTAAQDKIKATMGISDVSSLADKVLMCLPSGIGSWVANSGVNHWRAQFNDEWCISLTATMHEIGHMLGLIHSNENGIAYGDSTDYMASGQKASDWPRKCFNGLKNWQLGWYQSRQLTLDNLFEEGHVVKLAAFVDFDRTAPDEPVVANVADELYLEYNLATSFNADTEEKQNEVTITAPGETGSEGLAGLNVKGLYKVSNFRNSGHELVIEVCKRDKVVLGANMMVVSVAYDKSLCQQIEEEYAKREHKIAREETPAPSNYPTHQPSTNSPSDFPSIQPSKTSSKTPTSIPSVSPSATPTNLPTFKPTKSPIAPTHQPSNRPSTIVPTPEPKIDYFTLIAKRQKKVMKRPVAEIDELKSLFDPNNR